MLHRLPFTLGSAEYVSEHLAEKLEEAGHSTTIQHGPLIDDLQAEGTKNTGEYIDDSAITADVKGKLLGTKGISSNSVSVKTVNGVVYLSGFVKSADQMDKITQVASQVKGVKSVQNGLVIAN